LHCGRLVCGLCCDRGAGGCGCGWLHCGWLCGRLDIHWCYYWLGGDWLSCGWLHCGWLHCGGGGCCAVGSVNYGRLCGD
jgi:hypothetical protein